MRANLRRGRRASRRTGVLTSYNQQIRSVITRLGNRCDCEHTCVDNATGRNVTGPPPHVSANTACTTPRLVEVEVLPCKVPSNPGRRDDGGWHSPGASTVRAAACSHTGWLSDAGPPAPCWQMASGYAARAAKAFPTHVDTGRHGCGSPAGGARRFKQPRCPQWLTVPAGILKPAAGRRQWLTTATQLTMDRPRN